MALSFFDANLRWTLRYLTPLSRRDSVSVAAVVFDVDGTLYRQSALRCAMLFRLVRAHILHPREAVATLQILWSYRGVHEQLRIDQRQSDRLTTDGSMEPAGAMLGERQLMLTARRSGYQVAAVRRTIEEWIERSPLDLMLATRWPGVVECLRELRGTGIRIGALSDYPATAKLTAMGLSALFDVVVCAQDSDVGRLKPDPAGLRIVLARLDVPADHAVYVGDRPDLDAGAASAAGMRCCIIDRAGSRGPGWTGVRDYDELARLLANDAV
jgi:HAD superfamily hydrolase (TIGR01509 family)